MKYLSGVYYCSNTKRSEEHTSELQSQSNLVCRLLLEKKNIKLEQNLELAALKEVSGDVIYVKCNPTSLHTHQAWQFRRPTRWPPCETSLSRWPIVPAV